MRRTLKAQRVAAALTATAVLSLVIPSLLVLAQGTRAGHTARPQPAARAATATFTIHDHTLLMQAIIENLPKLLVTQELQGDVISTTNSGVIPAPSAGSPPTWPPAWFCKVTLCALDPTLILEDAEGASFISSKDRRLAKMVLSLAPKAAARQPTARQQGELAKLMTSLLADTSNKQLISDLESAMRQYPDLKSGLTEAIKVVKDGESTIYSPSWLKAVEAKDWGLSTVTRHGARRAFWLELWSAVKDSAGAGAGALVGGATGDYSNVGVWAVEASASCISRSTQTSGGRP